VERSKVRTHNMSHDAPKTTDETAHFVLRPFVANESGVCIGWRFAG
jgi:hypothetical protein